MLGFLTNFAFRKKNFQSGDKGIFCDRRLQCRVIPATSGRQRIAGSQTTHYDNKPQTLNNLQGINGQEYSQRPVADVSGVCPLHVAHAERAAGRQCSGPRHRGTDSRSHIGGFVDLGGTRMAREEHFRQRPRQDPRRQLACVYTQSGRHESLFAGRFGLRYRDGERPRS